MFDLENSVTYEARTPQRYNIGVLPTDEVIIRVDAAASEVAAEAGLGSRQLKWLRTSLLAGFISLSAQQMGFSDKAAADRSINVARERIESNPELQEAFAFAELELLTKLGVQFDYIETKPAPDESSLEAKPLESLPIAESIWNRLAPEEDTAFNELLSQYDSFSREDDADGEKRVLEEIKKFFKPLVDYIYLPFQHNKFDDEERRQVLQIIDDCILEAITDYLSTDEEIADLFLHAYSLMAAQVGEYFNPIGYEVTAEAELKPAIADEPQRSDAPRLHDDPVRNEVREIMKMMRNAYMRNKNYPSDEARQEEREFLWVIMHQILDSGIPYSEATLAFKREIDRIDSRVGQ